jgi:hypothetical protein
MIEPIIFIGIGDKTFSGPAFQMLKLLADSIKEEPGTANARPPEGSEHAGGKE